MYYDASFVCYNKERNRAYAPYAAELIKKQTGSIASPSPQAPWGTAKTPFTRQATQPRFFALRQPLFVCLRFAKNTRWRYFGNFFQILVHHLGGDENGYAKAVPMHKTKNARTKSKKNLIKGQNAAYKKGRSLACCNGFLMELQRSV